MIAGIRRLEDMTMSEFDFKRFERGSHTFAMEEYDKDVMRRVEETIKDEVQGARRWHEAQYHADKPLAESRVLNIVQAELDDHTGAFHDVPDDILHDKPNAEPQGVWVAPGDVVEHEADGKQGVLRNQNKLRHPGSIRTFGGNSPMVWEPYIAQLTTLDGQPVLGVR